MRKDFIKGLSFGIMAMMVAGAFLPGCGGGGDSTPTSTASPTVSPSPTSTASPTPSPTTSPIPSPTPTTSPTPTPTPTPSPTVSPLPGYVGKAAYTSDVDENPIVTHVCNVSSEYGHVLVSSCDGLNEKINTLKSTSSSRGSADRVMIELGKLNEERLVEDVPGILKAIPDLSPSVEEKAASYRASLKNKGGISSLRAEGISNEQDLKFLQSRGTDIDLVGYDVEDNLYSYKGRIVLADEDTDGSGRTIIVSELNSDGEPYVDHEKALEIDSILGVSNPKDKDGKSMLDRVRSIFGNERGYQDGSGGGIDGTEKLLVIMRDGNKMIDFSSGGYVAGYFTSNDEVFGSSYGNNGEMINIASPGTYKKDSKQYTIPDDFYSVLSHEFQHLIYYNTRSSGTPTTLNEAQSALAEIVVGYGPETDLNNGYQLRYKANQYCTYADWDIFTSWCHQSTSYPYVDYGKALLFSSYIYDRYGLEPFKAYNASGDTTFDGFARCVDSELTFDSVFDDWGKAMMLCDGQDSTAIQSLPQCYRMKTIWPGAEYDVSVLPKIVNLPYTSLNKGDSYDSESSEVTIYPWCHYWYKVTSGESTGSGKDGTVTAYSLEPSFINMALFKGTVFEKMF